MPMLHWRTTDWPRVARAVYRVRQHYRYTYTGPVTDLKQRLMMIPADVHGDQRLLGFEVDVRGASHPATTSWERDEYGNRRWRVLADRVEHAIDFEATYHVERRADEPARSRRPGPGPRGGQEHLHLTALTAADPRLSAVAAEIMARVVDPRERAERAHDWTAGAISYQSGVTGVQTPAAMALHLGRGVCQDYAHIMLCVLRLMGVPARYVSGHLLGEGAPHAWVEVLHDDASAPDGVEVIAYDPTHHRRAGLNYITVAVGRDYSDVAPTSGFFSGAASGKLSSSKQADIVELEYVDGRITQGAAA